jgi:hypothetical protein
MGCLTLLRIIKVLQTKDFPLIRKQNRLKAPLPSHYLLPLPFDTPRPARRDDFIRSTALLSHYLALVLSQFYSSVSKKFNRGHTQAPIRRTPG